MKEHKVKPNGIFLIRAVSAVLLLACLVFCICGCDNKEPEDTSFYIAKVESGAEFRLGEKGKVIGRLELPKTEDGVYSGEMMLYFGEEIWMRVWQEEDRGIQKVYFQSPDETMQLASWTDGDTPIRAKVRYNGAEEGTEPGKGVSLSLEIPQIDEDNGNLLLDIKEDGTLQFNLFLDRKVSSTVIEQIAETFIYRFTDNEWSAKDRVSSVARVLQSTVDRDLPSGTYTINVDITRDGASRQMRWQRTGLGEEGYRYLVTCAQDGTQVARLQTLSDTLGDVIVENASFAEGQLFTADASGHVRWDGSEDLLTGLTAVYAFGYNGTVVTEQNPETLKTGNAAGFVMSLTRSDDIYTGERAEDAQLTTPKYRNYLCLRFSDELSRTTVDVPLAYGEWITVENGAVSAETVAGQLSLLPQGPIGWDLVCSKPSAAENDPSSMTVGNIKTEIEVDPETYQVTYTGDVNITVPGASDFGLYRRCDGETCYVYAEFSGYRWLLATCPAEGGKSPLLNVSRYVELDDYTTPFTVYKLIYSVQLPDETEIAQFLTSNDGRLVVRLKADPTLTDRDWETQDDKTADDKETQDDAADNNATDDSSDKNASVGDPIAVPCDLLHGAKPTDITLEYAFRIAAGEGNGVHLKNIAVFTSISESIVRNGTTFGTATEKRYGDASDAVRIISEKDAENADERRFVCYVGTEEEASLSVEVTGDGKLSFREFTFTDGKTGEKQTPIRVKGGLLYADDVCVDTLSAAALQGASGNGSAKEYRPFEEWTSYETEHLVIRLRNVREYIDEVKSQDGTVITRASARRVVWAEVTSKSSGDSWSIPVGYGSWQEIPER